MTDEDHSTSAGLPLGGGDSPVPPGTGANPAPPAWQDQSINSPAKEEEGVLTVNNLPQFLDAAHRRADKVGIKMVPLLSLLEQLFSAITRGCPCTRKNREQHAEAVYMDTMMKATLRDKSDIMQILGVGDHPEDYKRAIIKSKDIILLNLTILSE